MKLLRQLLKVYTVVQEDKKCMKMMSDKAEDTIKIQMELLELKRRISDLKNIHNVINSRFHTAEIKIRE